MTAGEYARKKEFAEEICPYGINNFCDGTANKSVSKYIRTKEPCPYFEGGSCRLKGETEEDERESYDI